jgi:putative FmdB family regulatory protein
MPLYEFLCSKCMKILEFIVPLDKFETKVKCPHCKKMVKRLMSPVLFRIK